MNLFEDTANIYLRRRLATGLVGLAGQRSRAPPVVEANRQQVKSRSGAVYVTQEQAGEALQQLACLSLRRACLSVLLTHLAGSIFSSGACFSVSHLQACNTYSTGGVVC